MARSIDWDTMIGRRIRLRDLHALSAVATSGSMAGAARQLGVTQSAISQMVVDLESALGVRLFDRSPRGVEPTVYGRILLARVRAAFDELKQSLREIESAADPMAGQIRIGCPETISAAILPGILTRFSALHPRCQFEIDTVTGATSAPRLRDRSLDLVFARGGPGLATLEAADDMVVRTVMGDALVLVAGMKSEWARRRKVQLSDLVRASWIVLPYGWGDELLPLLFKAHGLDMPLPTIKTFSIPLRLNLVASGSFLTALPKSVFDFYAKHLPLKALPIEVPTPSWSVAVVTLKKRMQIPVVDRFVEFACKRS